LIHGIWASLFKPSVLFIRPTQAFFIAFGACINLNQTLNITEPQMFAFPREHFPENIGQCWHFPEPSRCTGTFRSPCSQPSDALPANVACWFLHGLLVSVISLIFNSEFWMIIPTWLVVWHMAFIFPYIGNVIIPTDEFIFFRGVGIPPTSN